MTASPWVGLVALALAAWLSAALLRAGRVPGALVLGGLVAGALLGPTFLGRLAPNLYEDALLGARAERLAHVELAREAVAWQSAQQAVDAVQGELTDAQRAVRQRDLEARRSAVAAAEERRKEAAWTAQQPLRTAALVLAGATLALAATPRRRDEPEASRASSISIGLWASGMPVCGALVLLWAQGWPLEGSAALMTIAALAAGPWRLDDSDAQTSAEAEGGGARLIARAALVSTAVAAVAAAAALHASAAGGGLDHPALLAGTLVLCGAPVACALFTLTGRRTPPTASGSVSALASRSASTATPARIEASRREGLLAALLLPPLAALAAVRIELLEDASLWPLVVLPLLSGDGRLLGAVIGALLPGGRAPAQALRLVLPTAACGPTQTAFACLGLHLGLIPASLAYGLLLGVALMEVSMPLRRRVDETMKEEFDGR